MWNDIDSSSASPEIPDWVRLVVKSWTQILDPGRRILHHWIAPPAFNLGCRRHVLLSMPLSQSVLGKRKQVLV
jgi:hypothetical protein